jgi:hypothetical protein
VLTEEKLDEIGARLEYTSWKFLRSLGQETGFKIISMKCHKSTPALIHFLMRLGFTYTARYLQGTADTEVHTI